MKRNGLICGGQKTYSITYCMNGPKNIKSVCMDLFSSVQQSTSERHTGKRREGAGRMPCLLLS